MTITVRSAPTAVQTKHALPFKLFVPRQIEPEPAKAAYDALASLASTVLPDPFYAPNVSTVFPGILYVDDHDHDSLKVVAAAIEPVTAQYPEAFEDAWLEHWVPEGYEDVEDALDITDLTQG